MAFDQPKSSENKDGFCLDTLTALVENGPLWDGDVPSKAGRDELLATGYAARVLVKGEDGFTAATYKGRNLYNQHWGGNTVAESKANRQAHRAILRAQQEPPKEV